MWNSMFLCFVCGKNRVFGFALINKAIVLSLIVSKCLFLKDFRKKEKKNVV